MSGPEQKKKSKMMRKRHVERGQAGVTHVRGRQGEQREIRAALRALDARAQRRSALVELVDRGGALHGPRGIETRETMIEGALVSHAAVLGALEQLNHAGPEGISLLAPCVPANPLAGPRRPARTSICDTNTVRAAARRDFPLQFLTPRGLPLLPGPLSHRAPLAVATRARPPGQVAAQRRHISRSRAPLFSRARRAPCVRVSPFAPSSPDARARAPSARARALYGTPAPRCTEVMRSPSESAMPCVLERMRM